MTPLNSALVMQGGYTSARAGVVAGDFTRSMVHGGAGGLIWTGEMTAMQIMQRHAAAQTGVFYSKLSQGTYTSDDEACIEAMDTEDWKLEIIDDTGIGIGAIAAEAKRLNSKWDGGLNFVVIDHLGLVSPTDKKVNREQQVGAMVRECKVHAQHMGVVWIVLCQINRAGVQGRPELWHMRDSGQIEESANTILMLDWDNETLHDAPLEEGGPWRHLLLRVAKQRAGISTSWNGAVQRKLRGCLTRTEPLNTIMDNMETK